MKYIRFYSDAWLSSTRIMSNEAKGAWIDLLCFLNAQSTPGEAELSDSQLSRLWGVDTEKMHELISDIQTSQVCEIEVGDTITVKCNRLIREAEEHAEFIEKCREAGKRGAKVKQGSLKPTLKPTPKRTLQGTSKRTHEGTHKHTNTNTNTNSNKLSLHKSPTLKDVLDFCDREKISQDLGTNFYDYHEGQQLWINKNGKPIQWWFVLRTWEKRGYGRSKTNRAAGNAVDRNRGNANEDSSASDFEAVGRVVRSTAT